MGSLLPRQEVFYLDTVDGTRYRVPEGLHAWAGDTIALTLAIRMLSFPCRFEFGVLDGRPYAELLAETPR